MKPSELYAMKPEKTDYDINRLWGCYYSHVPECTTDFDLYIEEGKIPE